ncbi:MAG: class I SAM-dependent methyltransferase [Ferruginibacter sp.]
MAACSLSAYIPTFHQRIHQLDPARVSAHKHASGYFAYWQLHAQYYLTIYSDMLERVLARTDVPKEQLGLLDVGCGNGLLGLFARFCGFGYVVLLDAHPDFVEASRNLAKELDLDQCVFVEGTNPAVLPTDHLFPLKAVVGADVIEHIYNIDLFLSSMKQWHPAMVGCFTTAANPVNWVKSRSIRQQQHRDEWDGFAGDLTKGEPPHASYRSIRASFLKQWFDEPTLSDWVGRTRGQTLVDVEKAVFRYLKEGTLPVAPDDPFNTCDPITGSWTERLLSFQQYQQLFDKQGWQLQIESGYYNTKRLSLRSVIYFFLNGLIFIFGKPIAPFLFLCVSSTPTKPA